MLLFGFRALPTHATSALCPSTHQQQRAHGHRVVELCATSCELAFVASAPVALDVVLSPALLAVATIGVDHRGHTHTDDCIHLTDNEFSCEGPLRPPVSTTAGPRSSLLFTTAGAGPRAPTSPVPTRGPSSAATRS